MARKIGREGITVRQRKLINGIATGQTVKDAAVMAGYPGQPETARVEASRDLQKPHVVAAIDKALDDAGATLCKSARVIAEAHDASRHTKNGDEPDHKTRLAAAEMNGKFRKLIGGAVDEGGQVMSIGFFIAKGLRERGLEHIIEAESDH